MDFEQGITELVPTQLACGEPGVPTRRTGETVGVGFHYLAYFAPIISLRLSEGEPETFPLAVNTNHHSLDSLGSLNTPSEV